MKTIVSGIKPSGKLHLGNYLGVIKNLLSLQNSKKYNCFYFIADYHSLTTKFDPKEKKEEIFEMAVDLLALGIDPKKAVFFIQSHILEHANLAWIFNNLISVRRLEGMIEYKEKISEGQNPNAGLLDYPVLMTADILIYNAHFVPVGEDQLQHLELARDIARTFNNQFGKFFNEPRAILTKIPRVMSLNNPLKKMSKTLPNGCLYLSDSPQIIRQKIKIAITDSENTIGYDPEKRPGISNLILIYSELSGLDINKVIQKYQNKGYFEFKNSLSDLIIEKLKPFYQKRKEVYKNKKLVFKILEKGKRKAEIVAKKNLQLIHKKIGLI